MEKFAVVMGWIIGLLVFGSWMMLVGSPHVTETIIGIVIAIISGGWTYLKISPE